MKKILASLLVWLTAALPIAAYAQSSITLPIAAAAVADIGNGPIKVRVIQGNASIFTAQGSGTGSTSGTSTLLTLTGTPAVAPLVGALVSGTGVTSGTTVVAYNGTTGITLSANATVVGGTAIAWGAACPASAAGIPAHYISASVMADYYLLYTQARVCAVSPGGPANTLLILPVFYDSTSPGGGGGGSGITALTGDVTASGTGSVAATLATVNANVGTFGSSTQCTTITVNGKGLITGASQTACSGGGGAVSAVSNSDGTLTISPTTGAVVASLALGNPNTWLAQQTNQGATTTQPGWFAQIAGDTTPRVRLGMDGADVPSLAFGPGNAPRDAFIGRAGAAAIRFGAPDAAAPVAQNLSVQNVVAGTSNTAGATATVNGSQGTGTGIGGSIVFKVAPAGSTGTAQNALVAALTIDSTKTATFAGTAALTAMVAPGTPSAGFNSIYLDSTDKRLHDKNDAGSIGTTVVADTGAANNYISAISAAGAITKSRPTCSTLSDSSTGCSAAAGITALTGDVTATGPGSSAAAVVNLPTGVTQAGQLLGTNIAAPSTPAAGKVTTWMDSTDLRMHDKNASGVIGTTVVADTGASNNFLTAISAAGAISKAQPSFSNISGTIGSGAFATGPGIVTNAMLANAADGTIKSNISGGSAADSDNTITAVLDKLAGTTQGSLIYRNASTWVALAPGTSGQLLQSGGASANPSWLTASGTGTVTSVICGGVTITASGTCPESFNPKNCSLAASVGSNILTVALKDNTGANPSASSPCRIPFRSATAATGSWVLDSVTGALSITTNATGATLGSISNAGFRFWVVAFDNGGTVVLSLYNASTNSATAPSCLPINEGVVQSSTAMSGSATAAGTYYTPNGTTLSNKAVKILGYVEYNSTGLATAGTYASGPNFIQTMGPGIVLPCMPTGNVTQTVTGTQDTGTTSTAYAASGFTATITPTSAANIIEASASLTAEGYNGTNGVACRIQRSTSWIAASAIQVSGTVTGNEITGTSIGLDFPNATTSTTYTIYRKTNNVATTVYCPLPGATDYNTIILKEIQG